MSLHQQYLSDAINATNSAFLTRQQDEIYAQISSLQNIQYWKPDAYGLFPTFSQIERECTSPVKLPSTAPPFFTLPLNSYSPSPTARLFSFFSFTRINIFSVEWMKNIRTITLSFASGLLWAELLTGLRFIFIYAPKVWRSKRRLNYIFKILKL